MTIKLDRGYQNIFKSVNYPSEIKHKVWPESIIWFKSLGCRQAVFGQKLTFKLLM